MMKSIFPIIHGKVSLYVDLVEAPFVSWEDLSMIHVTTGKPPHELWGISSL